MESRTTRYLLFFGGILALTVAAVALPAGISYEFELRAAYADAPSGDDGGTFVDYEALVPAERRMVRAAIDGRRYVLDRQGKLPRNGIGELTVEYRERYYTFSRRPFLDANTWPGRGAIGLAIVGLSGTAVAIQRDMRARR